MNIKKNLSPFKFQLILLGFILAVGIFLRSYNAATWFDFAHDGDLYSWVVKDIVVNHHQRLIGQVTSTAGIFIGLFFYYSIIPFFLLTNMYPIGVIYFSIILGTLTICSFYFVFKKLFSTETGLIAASLQAFLLQRVIYDRWVVPTVTTSIWEVWYFYSIVMISRGSYNVLPLLGLLAGLIWHINFSLAPSLIAVPFAILISRKLPNLKNIILGLIGLFIPSIPLIIFESRHGFSQYHSFLKSFQIDQGGGTGFEKFTHVLSEVSGNATQLLFYPNRGDETSRIIVFFLLLLLGLFITYKKVISRKLLVVLYIWIFGMIAFFSLSSKIITEYYFTNINIVLLAFIIFFFSYICKIRIIGKILVILIITLLAFRGIIFMIRDYPYNHLGYQERKKVAQFIETDAGTKNYPCVAISYISLPGQSFGFRYLFYLSGLKVKKPNGGAPIYSIVIPESLVKDKPLVRFGAFGVLVEQPKNDINQIEKSCQGEDTNLTDPVFGYTE